MTTYQQAIQRRWQYPQLWQGCVGAWCPSLGCQGAKLYDMSGLANNGTVNATLASAWTTPAVNGMTFNGSSDYVVTNSQIKPSILTTQFSVSMWLKATSITDVAGGLVGAFSASPNFSWSTYILASDGTLFFYCPSDGSGAASGYFTTTASVLTGSWIHAVCRWKSSTITDIFLNGSSANGTLTGSVVSSVFNNSGPVFFGVRGTVSQHMQGSIDDVVIVNRIMSPAEISLRYRLGRGGAYTQRPRAQFSLSGNSSTIFRRNLNSRSGSRSTS